MSPYERMAKLYAEEPEAKSFQWFVDVYLRNGWVVSANSDYFVMGKPVNSKAPVELFAQPEHVFQDAECDAWYISAMAGDMGKAWAAMPYYLPYLCYHRGQGGCRGLRFIRTTRIQDFSLHSTKTQRDET